MIFIRKSQQPNEEEETKKAVIKFIVSTYKYDVFVADKLLCEIVNYENGKSSSKVYDKFGRLKYVYPMDISGGVDNEKRTEYENC